MKPISAKVVRSLNTGSYLKVADNSKAKVVQVVQVIGYKGVKRRLAKAGVGDLVVVSVKEGDISLLGKVMKAIIIRQRKEYRRADGTRIKFEDNACVLLKDEAGNLAGTIIRGPVAREAVERWPEIGKIASIVV
ncbi:MAG: 50S ribosomal protein L14 [Candidatus Aenigmatarchaeota archaeon]